MLLSQMHVYRVLLLYGRFNTGGRWQPSYKYLRPQEVRKYEGGLALCRAQQDGHMKRPMPFLALDGF